jgi:N-acetylmuramoyl-L-alanine amidase
MLHHIRGSVCVTVKNLWTKPANKLICGNMLTATLMAIGVLTPSVSSAGTISDVTASDNAVTIYFDGRVDKASVFALAGPNRIAVDISGATTGGGFSSGGPVTSMRQGQFDPQTARIVLELDQPVLITGGTFSQDGRSLRLNMRQAASDEFNNKANGARTEILPAFTPGMSETQAFRASPPKKRYEVTAPIGRGALGKGMPRIFGPNDNSLPLVVIDAGHGGHDPGAINPQSGKREKDVTLAIAKSIRDELVKSGRVRVALTRDTDRYLVLQDRYGTARKMGANLFISIHADAAENPEANGATVYTLSETASDREAQRLAARENKADIINGVNLGGADSNVSSILIDLTQRETMNVSADFAKVLLREAKPNIKLRSNSHKFASFVVLKAPDTPSVLFETGYISNQSDAAFLGSAAGQLKIGRSVASAIQVHFARRLASR